MSTTASSQPAAPSVTPSTGETTPQFGRTALAILGSMLLLIVALTAVLVQTTWAAPEASVETPMPIDHPDATDLARH